MPIQTISPRDLSQINAQGKPLKVLDVRTPFEFQEVHCPLAVNLPLSNLSEAKLEEMGISKGPIYLICKSGSRGRQACEKLLAAGWNEVYNVDGGTEAWVKEGLPVHRGRKVISLERQVRIAAGLLVLLGVTLAYLVHPYLIGVSAFVGAGLVFAGVTDTCGMGLMLARMPWNRVNRPVDNSLASPAVTCQTQG